MLFPQIDSAVRHVSDIALRKLGGGGIVLTEHPKSGGTWIGSMIASAGGIERLHDTLFPTARDYIIHKHHMPGMMTGDCPVVVMRDGRDVMVSFYFHCYRIATKQTGRLTELYAEHLPFDDIDDVRTNLPRFIDRVLGDPIYPRFSWGEFVEAWMAQPGAIRCSYEEAKTDPVAMLTRVLGAAGLPVDPARIAAAVDEHSFEKKTGRAPGQEQQNSFLRKGVVGDWRNHFTPEAAEIFDRHAGRALIAAGYEPDNSWVATVT